MDSEQVERLYEAVNLKSIVDNIHFYATRMIYTSRVGDTRYAHEVLDRQSWDIRILAEADSNMFPYYVYSASRNDVSGSILRKMKELSKRCKVCGDDPAVSSLVSRPGECGEINDVVFDPGMSMKLSGIIYDDSGTHKIPHDRWDGIWSGEGYYIRFDSLGAFLAAHHEGYSEFDRFDSGNSWLIILKYLIYLDISPFSLRSEML